MAPNRDFLRRLQGYFETQSVLEVLTTYRTVSRQPLAVLGTLDKMTWERQNNDEYGSAQEPWAWFKSRQGLVLGVPVREIVTLVEVEVPFGS